MDEIDQLLLDNSRKIKILMMDCPGGGWFTVMFGIAPAQETLEPVLKLIEAGLFEWNSRTLFRLQRGDEHMVKYSVNSCGAINAIDGAEAIASIWRRSGYEVEIVLSLEMRRKIRGVLGS